MIIPGVVATQAVAASAVPTNGTVTLTETFQSISIEWAGVGSVSNVASVQYKTTASGTWLDGLDLIWDTEVEEYRGSLLLLEPGTTYDIQLLLDDVLSHGGLQQATWAEMRALAGATPTIDSETNWTAQTLGSPLAITGVSPAAGEYNVYQPSGYTAGDPKVLIDATAVNFAVTITNSARVIIRGFHFKGARMSGIAIDNSSGDVTDLIIEDCEVSHWGRQSFYTEDLSGALTVGETLTQATTGATRVYLGTESPDGSNSGDIIVVAQGNGIAADQTNTFTGGVSGETFTPALGGSYGHDFDSAIGTIQIAGGSIGNPDSGTGSDFSRIIIQDCNLHDPNFDANGWTEDRAEQGEIGVATSFHPLGPSAILFENPAGNNVVRYNRMTGRDPAASDGDWSGRVFNDVMSGGDNGSDNGSPGKNSDVYGNRVAYCWDDAFELEGGGQNVRVWNNFVEECYQGFGHASITKGPLYNFANILRRFRQSYTGGYAEAGANVVKLDTDAGALQWLFFMHNTVWVQAAGDRAGYGLRVNSPDAFLNLYSRNNILDATGYVFSGNDTPVNSSTDYELWVSQGTGYQNLTEGSNSINAAASYAGTDRPLLTAASDGQGDAVVLDNLLWSDIGAEQTGADPIEYSVGGGADTTLSVSTVAASADDAEQEDIDFAVDLTSAALNLNASTELLIGIRFTENLPPQGSTILAAWVEFTSSFTNSAGAAPVVDIYGEDADAAATFSTTTNDLSDRTLTTATVEWTLETDWVAERLYYTADISAIVQEVVSRGSYGATALALLIQRGGVNTNQKRAHAYDGSPVKAPKLYVLWSA